MITFFNLVLIQENNIVSSKIRNYSDVNLRIFNDVIAREKFVFEDSHFIFMKEKLLLEEKTSNNEQSLWNILSDKSVYLIFSKENPRVHRAFNDIFYWNWLKIDKIKVILWVLRPLSQRFFCSSVAKLIFNEMIFDP